MSEITQIDVQGTTYNIHDAGLRDIISYSALDQFVNDDEGNEDDSKRKFPIAKGTNSIAIGVNAYADGNGCVAISLQTTLKKDDPNTSFDDTLEEHQNYPTKALGPACLTIGQGSSCSSTNSQVIGGFSTIKKSSGFSGIFGGQSNVIEEGSEYATLLGGRNLTTNKNGNPYTVAIGVGNEAKPDTAFEIGRGHITSYTSETGKNGTTVTSENRRNIFEVDHEGGLLSGRLLKRTQSGLVAFGVGNEGKDTSALEIGGGKPTTNGNISTIEENDRKNIFEVTKKGEIWSEKGLVLTDGNISTEKGYIYTEDGNISTNTGNIYTNEGIIASSKAIVLGQNHNHTGDNQTQGIIIGNGTDDENKNTSFHVSLDGEVEATKIFIGGKPEGDTGYLFGIKNTNKEDVVTINETNVDFPKGIALGQTGDFVSLTASGDIKTALGNFYTTTGGFYAPMGGFYAGENYERGAAFAVGKGTSDKKSNSFSVKYNGDVFTEGKIDTQGFSLSGYNIKITTDPLDSISPEENTIYLVIPTEEDAEE